MDRFQNTSEQFYEDLKAGRTSNDQFERYIYGSSARRTTDAQDQIDERVRMDKAKMERQIRDFQTSLELKK